MACDPRATGTLGAGVMAPEVAACFIPCGSLLGDLVLNASCRPGGGRE